MILKSLVRTTVTAITLSCAYCLVAIHVVQPTNEGVLLMTSTWCSLSYCVLLPTHCVNSVVLIMNDVLLFVMYVLMSVVIQPSWLPNPIELIIIIT